MSNETERSHTRESQSVSVRLLGSDVDDTAAALAERGFEVRGPLAAGADVDCVVAGPGGADAPDASDATDARPADRPTVLYAPDPGAASDPGRYAGYARTGRVEALCDQLRWAARTDRNTAPAPGETTDDDDRLARLHEGAVSLVAAESPDDLFARTVEVASRLLASDTCHVAAADGGVLRTRASVGEAPDGPWPVDRGVVGDSYRTGATRLVHDARTNPRTVDVDDAFRSAVTVPLGDDAVLVVVSDAPGAFSARDRRLAELLGRYAAATLARVDAAAAVRQQRELVESLHEGTAALAAVTTVEAAAEVAVELAERILSFEVCYVGVREGETVVPYATSSGAPPGAARPMDVSEGLVGETLRTGEPQRVDRMDGEASEADPARSDYRSGISVPLGDEGVFQAVSTEPAAFDDTDVELAGLLADHLTETFSRVRAEADLRGQRERVARLHAATAELVGCQDVDGLYERTIETARSVLGFDTAYVFVARDDRFVPVAQSTHPDHDRIDPVPLDHGVVSETHGSETARLVRDVETADEAEPLQTEVGGGISVPLGDDAVFQAVSRDPETFDEFDLELAELLASHVTANRERLRAESELRSQRDRLGALFENVPDAAVSFELVGTEPHVRAVNSAFERVFGYDAAELVGENVDDYIVPPEEEERETAAELNARLRAGESLRTECRRRTADGVRTFILQVVPLELGAENVGGFAIYTDITARQERERELRRQNERLEEFANIVSHDLRNPLAVAEGYLDLAAESGDEAAFERVRESLDRMGRLVDDLLSLARKGQVVGDPVPLDLAAVARRAWGGVDTADATLDCPDSLPAEGDEGRLVDLFENLFRNAVEHAGETATVRVEPIDGDGEGDEDEDDDGAPAGFAVADDGPGIAPGERERVFEPGRTTRADGIGYGLAIVRRVAEAHGWSVTVAESAAGGARFEVRF